MTFILAILLLLVTSGGGWRLGDEEKEDLYIRKHGFSTNS